MKQKKNLFGIIIILVIILVAVIYVFFPRRITPKKLENTCVLGIRIMDDSGNSYTYIEQEDIPSEVVEQIYNVLSGYRCHKALKHYDSTSMKYDIQIGEQKEGYLPVEYRIIVGENNFRMDEGTFRNHQTIYKADNLQNELSVILDRFTQN